MKPGEEYPYLRDVGSPLTAEQLRPLDARCRCVQFSKPLASHEYPAFAEFLRAYPQVPLRMYGHYSLTPDLEFLETLLISERLPGRHLGSRELRRPPLLA